MKVCLLVVFSLLLNWKFNYFFFTGTTNEKSTLHLVYKNLRQKCASKGFELYISNLHNKNDSDKSNLIDVKRWIDGPLEAQGGHDVAANCLAEISSEFLFVFNRLYLFLSKMRPLEQN